MSTPSPSHSQITPWSPSARPRTTAARLRLGSRLLQKLTEKDIDELVAWMLTEGRTRGGKPGTGLGLRSVQLALNRLRSALTEAVRRQLVIRNVAQYTKIPRAARTAAAKAKAELQPWEADEVRRFLVAIKHERLFAPMLLSLLGMRPAEVCGLRWSDVDLDAEELKIENTRTIVDGEVIEKETKSEKGTRALPLPAQVTAALKSFKATQAAEKLALGEGYADTGYVLVDALGQPVRTDWLRRRFNELTEAAGVRRVRLYDTRHACLTFLATNGVPDVIVSAWAVMPTCCSRSAPTSIRPRATWWPPATPSLDCSDDPLEHPYENRV